MPLTGHISPGTGRVVLLNPVLYKTDNHNCSVSVRHFPRTDSPFDSVSVHKNGSAIGYCFARLSFLQCLFCSRFYRFYAVIRLSISLLLSFFWSYGIPYASQSLLYMENTGSPTVDVISLWNMTVSQIT